MSYSLFDGTGTGWDRGRPGQLRGLAVGVVTDNQDPDGLARVRVRTPLHEPGDTSYWARVAMPMAGKDRGTYFLPEIGDEVVLAADDHDPSHLYVLGSLWNGENRPPATNDDGQDNVRMIRSRKHHMLRFNDDDAEPEVELLLADGKHLLLDQDGVKLEDPNGNTITIDSSSGAIEITAAQKLTLKGLSVSVEATSSLDLKAQGTVTIQGAMVHIN